MNDVTCEWSIAFCYTAYICLPLDCKNQRQEQRNMFPNPPHVLHNFAKMKCIICCLPVSTSSTVDRCSRKVLYQHTELSVYPVGLYVDIASSILNPICTFNIKPNQKATFHYFFHIGSLSLIHARLDLKCCSFDSVNTTPLYLYTFHKVGLT